MVISGEKIHLRPVQMDDVPHLINWSKHPDVHRYVQGSYPEDVKDAAAWLQSIKSNRHNKRWAITTKNGQLIGDVELTHITWRRGEAELRICIGARDVWDRGFGTDAVSTVVRYGFERLNLRLIYLRVLADNSRAIRCYTKSGFQKEGSLHRTDERDVLRKIYLMQIENPAS